MVKLSRHFLVLWNNLGYSTVPLLGFLMCVYVHMLLLKVNTRYGEGCPDHVFCISQAKEGGQLPRILQYPCCLVTYRLLLLLSAFCGLSRNRTQLKVLSRVNTFFIYIFYFIFFVFTFWTVPFKTPNSRTELPGSNPLCTPFHVRGLSVRALVSLYRLAQEAGFPIPSFLKGRDFRAHIEFSL